MVNFMNIIRTYVEKKTADTTFVRKIRTFNVDEIDNRIPKAA